METDKLDFILLIPCYNNLEGLITSINSVRYSFEKFEILIVDDGSLLPIVKENFSVIDPNVQIKIIRIPSNLGILNALNTGLRMLKKRDDYKYIARLDAGDICHPERFAKQVYFLDAHPEIFLLGSWCRFENKKTGKGYNYITKTEHLDIVKEMHFKCSFIHPTIMFRREVMEEVGFYPEGYPHAEDYAFFWEIVKKYKTEILAEILVKIAITKGISQKNRKLQMQSRIKITQKYSSNVQLKILSLIRLFIILNLPYGFILLLKKYFLPHRICFF